MKLEEFSVSGDAGRTKRLAVALARLLSGKRTGRLRGFSYNEMRGSRLESVALQCTATAKTNWTQIGLSLRGGVRISLRNISGAERITTEASSLEIDHVAIAVFPDRFDNYVQDVGRQIPGSKVNIHSICVENSKMQLAEIRDPLSDLRIVFCRTEKGQSGPIKDFLTANRGEGIQHLAFAVGSILPPVAALNVNRIPLVGQSRPHSFEDAVIAFEDGNRKLMQAFTRPLLGATFVELIHRDGVDSFMPTNITRLLHAELKG